LPSLAVDPALAVLVVIPQHHNACAAEESAFLNTREELAVSAAAITVAAATLAFAALSPGSQIFGHTLIAGRNPREVALTFDDGPNDAITEALLDLLGRHDTRATFFMIGRFVRQRPALARRVHAAGHLIGNHTETHPWLTMRSRSRIQAELRDCNQALEDALGAPIRYFRPPHGARRPFVLCAARELGLTTVQWNIMAQDWRPIGSAQILRNVERGLERCRRRRIGANILLHDGGHTSIGADRTDTLRVTEDLLTRFACEGFRTVTVDAWG
jgi:peptidoglycan/xylan/chitin deacetylase (PgdA/CDA1 family)